MPRATSNTIGLSSMWSTIRRASGLIEHVCGHGCGHPNAGSVQYMEFMSNADLDNDVLPQIPSAPCPDSSWAVHGCDGCCGRADFPGQAVGAIKHAIKRYSLERPDLLEDLKSTHFLLWWGIMAALDEAKGLED